MDQPGAKSIVVNEAIKKNLNRSNG